MEDNYEIHASKVLLFDFKFLCLGLEATIIIVGSNVRRKGVRNSV